MYFIMREENACLHHYMRLGQVSLYFTVDRFTAHVSFCAFHLGIRKDEAASVRLLNLSVFSIRLFVELDRRYTDLRLNRSTPRVSLKT